MNDVLSCIGLLRGPAIKECRLRIRGDGYVHKDTPSVIVACVVIKVSSNSVSKVISASLLGDAKLALGLTTLAFGKT